MDTRFKSIFSNLSQGQLVVPWLENALLSDTWPESYDIKIDSGEYYGKGDGYFHPSSHALMGERELYYRFHPDFRDSIIPEKRSLQSHMTLAMGSALHGVIQTQFQMAGMLKPENTELEYVNVEHHVRGRIDFVLDPHPSGEKVLVEMKSLACSTPILTTSGWSTMGELKDGDEVYAPDGQPTKVIKAHPINLNRPCYEVKFRDGQSIVSDAEHLWSVSDRGRNRVMTTKEIAESNWYGGYRFRVPVTEPLQISEQELPVDPWILGMWLGDGDIDSVSITVSEEDLENLVSRLERLGLGYKINRYGDRAPRVYLHRMRSIFSRLGLLSHSRTGLLGRKHIPDIYMLGSEQQRRDLLAGLMDSDGTVGDHQAQICMINEPLMRQVLQLVRSLGYRATWNESRAKIDGRDCGPVYWVKFSTSWGSSPFAIPRKKQKWDAKPKSDKRVRTNAIVSVVEADTVPVRCITVAHESSLYVVGLGFVPTHNTQNSYAFKKQESIKPSWDAQMSLAMDNTGFDYGVLLVMESGWPYSFKEFRVPRNDKLLSEIYAKFDYVRSCIALNTPPKYCCVLGSKEMDNCPARFSCWLADEPVES